VLGVSLEALTATRTHERAHVRQFERWGVLLLVLYHSPACSRGARRHPYRDNWFSSVRPGRRSCGAARIGAVSSAADSLYGAVSFFAGFAGVGIDPV